MSHSRTILETARHDAQEMHKKVSANIAKAGAATWADVHAVQAEATALATKMKTITDDRADALKAGVAEAITKLEAAAKLVQEKATAGADDAKRANTALLEAASRAAHSLSHAVANLRTKTAKAIMPKKVAS